MCAIRQIAIVGVRVVRNFKMELKEHSLILTTSFYDMNQKILSKKGYFQNFSNSDFGFTSYA